MTKYMRMKKASELCQERAIWHDFITHVSAGVIILLDHSF